MITKNGPKNEPAKVLTTVLELNSGSNKKVARAEKNIAKVAFIAIELTMIERKFLTGPNKDIKNAENMPTSNKSNIGISYY
jgi:hypothetical protein